MRKRSTKKETDTEFLARLMAEGFDEVKVGLKEVRNDIDEVRSDIDEMRGDITSLQKGQAETHRRLDSIERKQMGMLHSMDEPFIEANLYPSFIE